MNLLGSGFPESCALAEKEDDVARKQVGGSNATHDQGEVGGVLRMKVLESKYKTFDGKGWRLRAGNKKWLGGVEN